MSANQLSFSLRTSSKVKTVHLVGNWDNYKGQLPLSCKERDGRWKGTFRFPTSTLKPGSRYWYYYIVDGYKTTENPDVPSTMEPTTKRMLNILNVRGSSSSGPPVSTLHHRGSSNRQSMEVPKGRSLSPSKIIAPRPSKPYASRAVREADYSRSPGVDDLAGQLEQASLYKMRNISPASASSVGSSLSSRSSGGSSPSSLSSLSDPSSGSECRCNRWGVTRKGDRIRIDCGGRRCGYSDDSSSQCSSVEESESESEEERPRYQEIKPRQSVTTSRRPERR